MQPPVDNSGFTLLHGTRPPLTPWQFVEGTQYLQFDTASQQVVRSSIEPPNGLTGDLPVSTRSASDTIAPIGSSNADTIPLANDDHVSDCLTGAAAASSDRGGVRNAGVSREVQEYLSQRGFNGRLLSLLGGSDAEAKRRAEQLLLPQFKTSDVEAVMEAWQLAQAVKWSRPCSAQSICMQSCPPTRQVTAVTAEEPMDIMQRAASEVTQELMENLGLDFALAENRPTLEVEVRMEDLQTSSLGSTRKDVPTVSYTAEKRRLEQTQLQLQGTQDSILELGSGSGVGSFAERMRQAQSNTREQMLLCRAAGKAVVKHPEEKVSLEHIRCSIDAAKAESIYVKTLVPRVPFLCDDVVSRKQ